MKKFAVIFLMLPFLAQAQSVGIKDIPADGEAETTIEIKKGKNTQKKFEVVTNEDEIEGDAAPLLKDARVNWKKACADWKSETKALNKENQVISLSCGKMECATVSMESTCQSKAKYTVKVQVQ
ncbi:hypothetical protein AZI86_05600 [Bdellovibrio bacteriovorus]|uniref:Uncharacterized protein n=1 Tax=Bdellovibrio bacteriovorus TaxID=959 RepID=A0A150WPU1_BDEBC|nr:hypothetical protein [Bdellovibrio bacteriovorus]KYG66521.1 hypothetical protein AZI86_05600 [Bdellovibrio bacteriovorus]